MEKTEKAFATYLKDLFKVPEIDRSKSLTAYGMDSFMSIVITEWCNTNLKAPIKQVDLLLGMSMADIFASINQPHFKYIPRAAEADVSETSAAGRIRSIDLQGEGAAPLESSWKMYLFLAVVVVACYVGGG